MAWGQRPLGALQPPCSPTPPRWPPWPVAVAAAAAAAAPAASLTPSSTPLPLPLTLASLARGCSSGARTCGPGSAQQSTWTPAGGMTTWMACTGMAQPPCPPAAASLPSMALCGSTGQRCWLQWRMGSWRLACCQSPARPPPSQLPPQGSRAGGCRGLGTPPPPPLLLLLLQQRPAAAAAAAAVHPEEGEGVAVPPGACRQPPLPLPPLPPPLPPLPLLPPSMALALPQLPAWLQCPALATAVLPTAAAAAAAATTGRGGGPPTRSSPPHPAHPAAWPLATPWHGTSAWRGPWSAAPAWLMRMPSPPRSRACWACWRRPTSLSRAPLPCCTKRASRPRRGRGARRLWMQLLGAGARGARLQQGVRGAGGLLRLPLPLPLLQLPQSLPLARRLRHWLLPPPLPPRRQAPAAAAAAVLPPLPPSLSSLSQRALPSEPQQQQPTQCQCQPSPLWTCPLTPCWRGAW